MNLANCRACGGEAMWKMPAGGYGMCVYEGCGVTGPANDPTGSKWNALMAQHAPGLSDEELLARFAAAIVGGSYAADANINELAKPWVMKEARALLAEFRKAQP